MLVTLKAFYVKYQFDEMLDVGNSRLLKGHRRYRSQATQELVLFQKAFRGQYRHPKNAIKIKNNASRIFIAYLRHPSKMFGQFFDDQTVRDVLREFSFQQMH